MFQYLHNYRWISLTTLFAYGAIMMAAMLHVHPVETHCDTQGVCITAAACCNEHHHSDAGCSLCDCLQTINPVTIAAESFFHSKQAIHFPLTHQTIANLFCFGDAPIRAPPVC